MFREFEPLGTTAGAIGNGGHALRHPDGTINFSVYRERARRARAEAIGSLLTEALRLVGRLFRPGR